MAASNLCFEFSLGIFPWDFPAACNQLKVPRPALSPAAFRMQMALDLFNYGDPQANVFGSDFAILKDLSEADWTDFLNS